MIRPATIQDISSIVNLRLDALTDEDVSGFAASEGALYSSVEKLRKTWDRKNILKDGFQVFVAEEKGIIIGFVVFRIDSDFGNLYNIVVAKKKQGKDVGRTLVVFVEKLAMSKGCSLMKTDTSENAEGVPWKAYGFWRRLGFKDTGDRLPTKYDFKEIPFIKKLE